MTIKCTRLSGPHKKRRAGLDPVPISYDGGVRSLATQQAVRNPDVRQDDERGSKGDTTRHSGMLLAGISFDHLRSNAQPS
jgi:hypothetical protein